MTAVLTADVVSAVLRARVDPAARCRDLRRGAIGNGQETWFVTVEVPDGTRELVLRRTAEGGPLEWTDRRAEARVMNLAADHGFPVPRVHWVADEDSELGRPYLVMARAPGDPVGSDDRQGRAEELARWLARLHDAGLATTDAPTRADEATRDEITRWGATFRQRRPSSWPLVDALLAALGRALPPRLEDVPAVLVWGDAGLHNVLADGEGITALLDWELAHAGHPLEDLGAAVWMEWDGAVDVDAVVAAYADESGRAVPRTVLELFVALACVTRAIMILGAAAALVDARTHAPSLAGLALDLPVHQLTRAAALLGWEVVDDPAPPSPDAPSGPRPDPAEADRAIARHLAEDVLPQVGDRHTRRGLRTAVALLETSARRVELGAWARDRERARNAALAAALAEQGVDPDDLGAAVARVEAEDDLADLRPAVRRWLLEDLADRRVLLAPLASLYRPSP